MSALEWPTLIAAFVIYGSFLTATWFHEALPGWLLFIIGGYIVAWHGSLQHEAVHGHPTRLTFLNEIIAFPSLWLYMPYRVYRQTHLDHHADEGILTDPEKDPESYYFSPGSWGKLAAPLRPIFRFNNTLLGRLSIGPALAAFGYWRGEVKALASGSPELDRKAWLIHGVSITVVLYWAIGICGLSFFEYLFFFAYPGMSFTLLRSYLEHRARPDAGERSVVVEAEAPFALLFLNNNLHIVHHRHPGMPWYRLPAFYRARRNDFLSANGDYRFKGYREVFWRYFLKAKEPLVHPFAP